MSLQKPPTVYAFCDVNACFAQLAILNLPYLKGKCVAIGGDEHTRSGIVLACCHNAKKFGIRAGTVLWEARQRCPKLEVVPIKVLGRQTIRRMTDTLVELCYTTTPRIDLEGDDGCYMDWTGCVRDWEEAEYKAHELRLRFFHQTGLTISVGVSFCRTFAKLAGELEKPFGCTVIRPDNWQGIVWPLPASDLYWVGPATTRKLCSMGINTIGQLANAELSRIFDRFGLIGRYLWNSANGKDTTPVTLKDEQPEMFTAGNSTTALQDLYTMDDILGYTTKLCEQVSERLRRHRVYCTGINVSLRSAESLGWYGRQKKLPFPTRTRRMLYEQAYTLIQRHWDGNPLRGMGIRAYSLVDDEYLQMAILPEMLKDQRDERIDQAVQEIHRRMGTQIIVPGRVYLNRGLMELDLTSVESANQNAFRKF